MKEKGFLKQWNDFCDDVESCPIFGIEDPLCNAIRKENKHSGAQETERESANLTPSSLRSSRSSLSRTSSKDTFSLANYTETNHFFLIHTGDGPASHMINTTHDIRNSQKVLVFTASVETDFYGCMSVIQITSTPPHR